MGTMTAQLLIGKAHPYEGGIYPSHYMFLSENGTASWTLYEINSPNKPSKPYIANWIPTVDYLLEDAIVMIGLYVIKDEELIGLAKRYIANFEDTQIRLYEHASELGLEKLRARAKQIEQQYKITLSGFYGSSILNQIEVLEKYQMEVEVCLPVFAREYSVWTKETVEKGSLKNA